MGRCISKNCQSHPLEIDELDPALIGDIDPGASLDAYVGHQRVKTT